MVAAMARRTLVGLSLCATLLTVYATLAWAAASRQSPAFDEPYHALSSWVQLRQRDFRIDAEDPPLWQYWAAIPNGSTAVRFDPADPQWRAIPDQVQMQWPWCARVLYRTPGTDAAALVRRCRAMMLALAVALGTVIAAWAWRLAGPVAAVVATGLFCLDPNFLAHGPLMKNDVVFSLAWTGLAAALWWAGRRVTAGAVVAMAAAASAMLTIKFSGLIAVPLVPLVLGLRAVLPTPWPVLGRSIDTRGRRLAVAAGLTIVVAACCFAAIWAAYGFRFSATPEPSVRLNFDQLARRAAENAAFVRGDRAPSPTLPVRAVLAADQHHLMPEAYLGGFLFTYALNLVRPAFLLGRVSLVGWWYYFPLAMAFKTPLGTVAAALALAAAVARRRWWANGAARWSALALLVPFGLFLASAMSSNLNIGLRHVLPLYPLLFVTIGWAAASAARRRPRAARTLGAVIAIALVAETATAFPNYISFFNRPSAAMGDGGIALLGDSNLDWGQGLIELAEWRRQHPGDSLYLSYFGLADPASFGLRYRPMPGGYRYDRPPLSFPDPNRPCWVAVSITQLQGTMAEDPVVRAYYQRLAATRRPTAVVGGSICIYRYDPLEELRAGR
jgi:hypothetical protein